MKQFLVFLFTVTALLCGQEKRSFFLTSPEGCAVFVNGISAGITPCSVSFEDSLLANSITIRIQKQGYLPIVSSIPLAEIHDTLTYTLQPGASLSVNSLPESASVFINGTLFGRTPLTIDTLPAAAMAVTVVKQFYYLYKIDVTTIAGQNIRLSPILQKFSNTISLKTQDPSTQILLDGKLIGTGSVASVETKYGAHTISVYDPATGISAEQKFILSAMESKRFESQIRQFSVSKMALGIALPGFNQCSDGDFLQGILLSGASLYGVYHSIKTMNAYTKALDSYNKEKNVYDNLSDEYAVILSRAKVATAHSAMTGSARTFNTSLIIPAVVWLLNGFSVITSHSITDSIIELSEGRSVITPSANVASLNISCTIAF